jgi:hypothetical protein
MSNNDFWEAVLIFLLVCAAFVFYLMVVNIFY